MTAWMTSPQNIIEFLQTRLEYRKVCEDWIQAQIIRSVAMERGISVSEDEIQAEADRQRHERQLERASDTLAWLESEAISPEQWEQGMTDHLLRSALAENLFGHEVERIFAENRLNYEQRAIYRLEITDQKLADELFYQIDSGEVSFFEAVYHYEAHDEIRDRCGFEGLRHRWHYSSAQAQVLFTTQAHQILAPIETETGFILFWVGRIIPATLTPEIRATILSELLNQWLAAELIRWIHYHSSSPLVSETDQLVSMG